MCVQWDLNLAAACVFGIVVYWPATTMRGIEPREGPNPEGPILKQENSDALYRKYMTSIQKFHKWLYSGREEKASVDATVE
jgi:hypothetical protein